MLVEVSTLTVEDLFNTIAKFTEVLESKTGFSWRVAIHVCSLTDMRLRFYSQKGHSFGRVLDKRMVRDIRAWEGELKYLEEMILREVESDNSIPGITGNDNQP